MSLVTVVALFSLLGCSQDVKQEKRGSQEVSKSREITRAEIGDWWPFTVEQVTMDCKEGIWLVIADGNSYPLYGTQIGPILLVNPDRPPERMSLLPIMDLARKQGPCQSPTTTTGKSNSSFPDNLNLAFTICKNNVKDQLKAPSTAKWPGLIESRDHIKSLGGGRYRIESWVDSQNAFGAMIRIHYTAVVEQKDEHTWSTVSLETR